MWAREQQNYRDDRLQSKREWANGEQIYKKICLGWKCEGIISNIHQTIEGEAFTFFKFASLISLTLKFLPLVFPNTSESFPWS